MESGQPGRLDPSCPMPVSGCTGTPAAPLVFGEAHEPFELVGVVCLWRG